MGGGSSTSQHPEANAATTPSTSTPSQAADATPSAPDHSADAANATASSNLSATTDEGGNGGAPLTIGKKLGVIPRDDTNTSVTVAVIDSNGQVGAPRIVTFGAGSGGTQTVPGLCNAKGQPNNIAVGISGPSNGSSTLNGGSVTYDPKTCLLSSTLSGGHYGNTYTFTCPDNAKVNVTAAPAAPSTKK
jgi:hypothetical protein